jgi:hypothetical protein
MGEAFEERPATFGPAPSETNGALAEALPPLDAYRAALRVYPAWLARSIASAVGVPENTPRTAAISAVVAERLGEPRTAERLLNGLPIGSRLAMSLFALSETASWPFQGLAHALRCLGVEPLPAVRALLDLGLLAAWDEQALEPPDFDRLLTRPDQSGPGLTLRAHPGVLSASRTVLPGGPERPKAYEGAVRQERETDGLEPIVRMAVVWQRVSEAPLRQTQLGTFYKRDRERLEDDPTVAGPIADALEPLPDMPAFGMNLARGVGLLESERGSDRVTAAPPEFWSENAYHLPQMVAALWLALRTWHEQGGMQQEGAEVTLALPFVRVAVLLWLATLQPDEWVALEDLAAFLRERSPRWDRPAFQGPESLGAPGDDPGGRARSARGKNRKKGDSPSAPAREAGPLEAMLLGAAYQLNLVRVAEGIPSGRRLVRLTSLGRYLLALGPPPTPRPVYEHFLFVQPNFEVIAYRQGLTPALIGRFSRFTAWSQVGAAMALRLTPESVYRGLEGGLTPQAMLELLQRHSQRPLPAGVAEALRTWAGRRERVTYHASATLVEFANAADLEQALLLWPPGKVGDDRDRPGPLRVSDRLLLVEDEDAIPYARFRKTGSRDYRKPPEVCVEVEHDGVTLSLDPVRSDLLVDAELARFADEKPAGASSGGDPRRRFVVSSGSLARATEAGLTPSVLAQWFPRRTVGGVPPAIRLLLMAASNRVPALSSARPMVLRAPAAEVIDGLEQHPETRDLLGERLGPTSVVIPDDLLPEFRRALERIGLTLPDPATTTERRAGSGS